MNTDFDTHVKELYGRANHIITAFLKAKPTGTARPKPPEDFTEDFFRLVDKVNLGLLEDSDNFYGYFLFQMAREIRFDISSPTAVNFKGANYVLHFNPVIFLTLTLKQMETTVKHEILHVVSLHLVRAREFKNVHSTLAINMAMDVVVNTYLDHLPPYATTLEWVNTTYQTTLLPFEPFEYYVGKIQAALDLLEPDEDGAADDHIRSEMIEAGYDPEKTHDIWEESGDIDEKTLAEFTAKYVNHSQKGSVPHYLEGLLSSLKNSRSELPWNVYLKKLMGTVESNHKKTITRRNRRQPERLDLRGQLRRHQAKIIVALDISGSISDEEFQQAVKEVLGIVKNHRHEITVLECDSEIRRSYKVKTAKDIKERTNHRGGTKFTPVFEYANRHNVNLLVYFTDGKGEDELQSAPRGYKILWVLSGRGDKLSLKEAYGAVKKLNALEIKENPLNMNDIIRDGYSMNFQEKIQVM